MLVNERVHQNLVLWVLSLAALTSVPSESFSADKWQGWTADERQEFYYLSQGSQLVPYFWFVALEMPDSDELFRSDQHLASLGFIPQGADAQRNPDALPIGFVKDDNPRTVTLMHSLRKEILGPGQQQQHFPTTNAWLGFTCAACHTAELAVQGNRLRVDGGQAMIDFERFQRVLTKSLRSTETDDEKFERFARRVLAPNFNAGEANALRPRLAAYADAMERLVDSHRGSHPYGYGRLDAFGAILNKVCETALEVPRNHRPADAPVSYPFLWDAPHLDWVQWNGSAANPIARNVGEVLGVFAHIKLTGTPDTGQFTSTARVDNLFHLEQLLAKLEAPEWPSDAFGKIDRDLACHGGELFRTNCAQCHGIRDEQGQFPLTPPNALGKRFIATTMVPLERIRTDPTMALNFARRTALPGALAPHLPEQYRNQPYVPAAVLLGVAVSGTIQSRLAAMQPQLDPSQLAVLSGYRDPAARPPNLLAYKARPLNGAWATAPFLHNGSVPSLYDLLLPAEKRPKTFRTGSQEFDPKRVGLAPGTEAGGFLFRVTDQNGQPIPGNSNAGHSGEFHTHHRSGGGHLREFTDAERWALIEYIKTLR